jgi:leader peptidase (prepilin peptidase)/N-methyltransferase
MEITIGALLPLLYWHYGLSPELGMLAFYCCLFIVLLVIDWEKGLILNRLVYPSMIVALLFNIPLLVGSINAGSIDIAVLGSSIALLPPGIAKAAIGGGIGFGMALLVVLFSRGGMGFGDVKMAALIGLVVGFPLVFFTLIMAAVLGGIVAVILLLLKKKKRKETIPFGPSLSVASIVTLIWGADILGWWLGLF